MFESNLDTPLLIKRESQLFVISISGESVVASAMSLNLLPSLSFVSIDNVTFPSESVKSPTFQTPVDGSNVPTATSCEIHSNVLPKVTSTVTLRAIPLLTQTDTFQGTS